MNRLPPKGSILRSTITHMFNSPAYIVLDTDKGISVSYAADKATIIEFSGDERQQSLFSYAEVIGVRGGDYDTRRKIQLLIKQYNLRVKDMDCNCLMHFTKFQKGERQY